MCSAIICSWDRYWGHAGKVLASFSPVFAKVSELDPVSLLFLNWQIAHFTVTGEHKAGVDLGLIQPSPLYYVNEVLLMLTTSLIFQHNFHKKRKEVLIKTRSPSVPCPLKGCDTKPTTVKWSIGKSAHQQ